MRFALREGVPMPARMQMYRRRDLANVEPGGRLRFRIASDQPAETVAAQGRPRPAAAAGASQQAAVVGPVMDELKIDFAPRTACRAWHAARPGARVLLLAAVAVGGVELVAAAARRGGSRRGRRGAPARAGARGDARGSRTGVGARLRDGGPGPRPSMRRSAS